MREKVKICVCIYIKSFRKFSVMVKILYKKLVWILSVIFNFLRIKKYEVSYKYFLN